MCRYFPAIRHLRNSLHTYCGILLPFYRERCKQSQQLLQLHGPHRKPCLQQFFIAETKCLLNCCLATTRRYKESQGIFFYTKQTLWKMCLTTVLLFNVFGAVGTSSLGRGVTTVTILMEGFYNVRRWDGIRWMLHVPSFMKIGSGIQKLMGEVHR